MKAPNRANPGARTQNDPRSPDRTIRALMSLVDDLTVEREEGGLLRSTLEHVVVALGLSGGLTLTLGEGGALTTAAETRATSLDPALVHEVAQAAIDRARPSVRELEGGGWLAAAPLKTRQRQLGVLILFDTRADSLSPDVDLLEALGKQVGNGLDNVRLYAELRSSSQRVEVLNRITSTLTSGLELKTVVPPFARELRALESFDRFACGFVNDTGDYIEIVAFPEDQAWGIGSVLPVVGSGPGFVVLNNRAFVQKDLVHNHRFIEDMRLLDEGLRSYVLLPLNSRGRGIGVLGLASQQREAYDDSTLARLQPLADSVALAFENVRLFQKTRELSITDEVTPLYNFRYFHQILDRELKLVDRYKSVLSLVFVDLDRFKPINDQYGHLRGSRTLREVGFLIRAAVRETDYPARYGGDEFVVVLPQTDRASASALAEKLRNLLEEHVFLQEEGINARLGASLGIATYPTEAQTKESLIRLADKRMYEDKIERKAGR
ncbi:MAG TPA: diguanylate cyclase [Vicinamibacteria bacterium]|nr:diguanylate cyclase [Vicinamibacteria bacterium]